MARPPGKQIKHADNQKENTITHIRNLLGVSQMELSAHLDVSQPRVSYYENGLGIPVDHAWNILRVFRRLAPPEHKAMIDALSPDDLPRSWESVTQSISMRNHYERDDANVAVVVG